MKVVVAGGGKVGRHIAADLAASGHQVVVIEQDPALAERLSATLPARVVTGDVCDIDVLTTAEVGSVDVAIAATGDDEDNLVFSLLSKQEFGVGEVIARVNSPRNERLFTSAWGIDTAVSLPHLMTAAVGEKVTVGRVVRLLALEGGSVRLVELTLAGDAPAVGQTVAELGLPTEATLVAVVREHHVIIPLPGTVLEAGDELLAVVSADAEEELRLLLEATG